MGKRKERPAARTVDPSFFQVRVTRVDWPGQTFVAGKHVPPPIIRSPPEEGAIVPVHQDGAVVVPVEVKAHNKAKVVASRKKVQRAWFDKHLWLAVEGTMEKPDALYCRPCREYSILAGSAGRT